MKLTGKIFKTTFLSIFLVELFSIFGYLLPTFNKAVFLIIVLLTLILSLKRLEYGIWIILAELFIGSKGYLFFFEHNGIIISIRIALWLIIMAVWLSYVISKWLKRTKDVSEKEKNSTNNRILRCFISRGGIINYYVILFIFIIWGVVNGVLNNNEYSNIFFDFNGWLYFALIFPVFSVIKDEKSINSVLQIFTASILWLSIKTFFLLFAFSHNMIGMISELYRWVRVTGVGEITQMQGGFYRIFFQSHIFVLVGIFVFLLLLTHKKSFTSLKEVKLIALVCLLLSVILVSFSRSFWVGLVIGLLIYWFINLLVYKIGWKKFFLTNSILLLTAVLSIGLMVAIVKFPYPKPLGGFATTELLSERASKITNEAGVSSRWSLLPELLKKIASAPILGQGFGAIVAYKSSDPRVLQSSPTGEYTTYAFEWGWLDIWLKLGIFGMIAYLVLLFIVIRNGVKSLVLKKESREQTIIMGFVIGLIVIIVVNFFSPYMNHPLGIGYLLITSAVLDKIKQLDNIHNS